MRGSRFGALVAAACWASATAGCAGPLVGAEGGFRHRKHDYWIALPPAVSTASGPGWERIDVEGSDLAFRRGKTDTMSLQSRCGRPVADAALMARHLVIGLSERDLLQAGPVLIAGENGWTQTFATVNAGRRIQVKTVTLVSRGCSFDWILATTGDLARVEPDFDAWWASFRRTSQPKRERRR